MNSKHNLTIARVIARLNVGGPAIQAILMTDAFRQKGYRTLLLTGEVPEGEGSMEYLARERNIAPIKIGTLSRRISWHKDLATLWQLIRILRRERPLVLHTHTAKAGTLGRLAALATGVPVRVHTFHGHVFRGYFSPLVTRAFLAVERFLARHTDRIIAISDSQKHELAEVLAGVVCSAGPIRDWRDGNGEDCLFGRLTGIVSDGVKCAYVSDTSNNCIRRLTMPDFMFH